MAAEEIKLGKVKLNRKAIMIGGAVAAGIIGYAYYMRSTSGAGSAGEGEAEELIDPYTGLPLADEFQFPVYQAQTITDPSGNPIGTGLGGQVVTQVDTNAGWSQAAIAYLSLNASYEPSALISALGKGLIGQAVTPDEAAMFNAARAVMGEPPQPWGLNGNRSLNIITSPPPGTTNPGGNGPKGSELARVTDLHAQQIGNSFVIIDWTDHGNLPQAKGYYVYVNGQRWRGLQPAYSLLGVSALKPKTKYQIQVRPVGTDNVEGPVSNTLTVTTK